MSGESRSSTIGLRSPESHDLTGAPNPAFGLQITSFGSTPPILRLNMYFRVVRLSFRDGGIDAAS